MRHSPHLRSRELCPSALGWSIYIICLFLCMRHCLYLPYLLIYSIAYLYQDGFMGIYFILWVIIQCHSILLFKLSSVGLGDHFYLSPVSLWHNLIIMGFFFSLLFLSTTNALGSSCIFPVPVFKSIISSRCPAPSYWRIVLESKIWKLIVFLQRNLNCIG